ncbi:MAG: prenyltransferase/squalene oxidase repeat-containing protein [Aureliella sp.]
MAGPTPALNHNREPDEAVAPGVTPRKARSGLSESGPTNSAASVSTTNSPEASTAEPGIAGELDNVENGQDPNASPRRWLSLRPIVAWCRKLTASRTAPGFLISLILHTTLLLVLALWTVAGVSGVGGDWLTVVSMGSDPVSVEVDVNEAMLASGEVTPDAVDSVTERLTAGTTGVEQVSAGSLGAELKDLAPETEGPGSGVRAPEAQSAVGDLIRSTADGTNASLTTISVEGRNPESRKRLALERGGSADSEAAVELALKWLAAHQRPNGSWSLVHTTESCGNYCTHPGSPERYEPAATGLALLAFLGAGYTHRDGQYTAVVRKGVYYLLQIMEEAPQGGSFLYNSPQGMYNQGVATFALCEAYQLSGDESLKIPCQRAIDFIAYSQNDVGGWGYLPKRPGDLTITGWQTMALKSADGAGLYIPAHTIVRLDQFLDSQTDSEKIFYGYGAPGKSETCTAIGLLLRLFRNWPHSDPRVLTGVSYLQGQGISAHDVYRNYYATLLMYHVGGWTFKQWNPHMRDSLVRSQNKNGHAAGSWYFEDKYAEVGGRLYTTAMAAMTLEVYYRFSPIYLNSDRPFEY